MEYEDVDLGGKVVHFDTPLIDAMAQTSLEAARNSRYWPYVAVTPACLSALMDEHDAMCDAIESHRTFDPGSLARATEDRPAPYFAYDVVMVDDLPEGVDWEWRTRDEPPEIQVMPEPRVPEPRVIEDPDV